MRRNPSEEIAYTHWRRLGPRFGGDEVGALAPKKFFLPSPPKCEIWGDGGGLTVFANYNIQPMDFVYI